MKPKRLAEIEQRLADPKVDRYCHGRSAPIPGMARELVRALKTTQNRLLRQHQEKYDAESESVGRIYRDVDARFRAGHFASVDVTLRMLDVSTMSTIEMLAYASITRVADDKLPGRLDYMCRVRDRLTMTEPKRVNSLLDRLE